MREGRRDKCTFFEGKWLCAMICLMSCFLLAGCGQNGKEDETEFGIDGYGYLAEEVSESLKDVSSFSWRQEGDRLYFINDGKLKSTGLDELKFSRAQTYFGDYGTGNMDSYAADENGDIYYWYFPGTIYKYSAADKSQKEFYNLQGKMIKGIAAFGGKIFLLLEDSLITVDSEGKEVSSLSGDQLPWRTSLQDGGETKEYLKRDGDGNLYYCRTDYERPQIWVLLAGESQWKELEKLPKGYATRIYAASSGRIRLELGGILYEADAVSGEVRQVLRFLECGLTGGDIREVVSLSEEELLVVSTSNESGGGTKLYRLKKVPVEEMPKREYLVLVSFMPNQMLEMAVAQFNSQNSDYFVLIDDCGAEVEPGHYYLGEARMRLDSRIVGSNCPDLLDVSVTSVTSYVENGVLEDLTPYIEASDKIHVEDYLPQVIAGHTVDGQLISIPKSFSVTPLAGRKSELEGYDDGSFEGIRKVMERYPDRVLLFRNYMLYYYCYTYYMETFVNWETGECSFDSEEFRDFVRWLEKVSYTDDALEEKAVLQQSHMFDFYDLTALRYEMGEEPVWKGMLTGDGRELYSCNTDGDVAILTNSKHKDGAWAFLEYFLELDDTYDYGFYTEKSRLDKQVADAMEDTRAPALDENGDVLKDENGKELYSSGIHRMQSINGEMVPIYEVSQEDIDLYMDIFEHTDFNIVDKAGGATSILVEELGAYFDGDKSLEEATRIINSRMQLFISELL